MPLWAPRKAVFWLRPLAVALLFVAAMAIVACDRGGSDSRDQIGAGFLPTATPFPRVPGSVEGFYGWCPPLPRPACLQPGDSFNPYRDLSLDRVVQIEGHAHKEPFKWILDPGEISQVVSALQGDARVDTEFAPDTIDSVAEQMEYDRQQISFAFTWAPGFGAFGHEWGRLDFHANTTRNTVGFGFIEWRVRPEFLQLLMSYWRETPPASPAPTPTVLAAGAVFFAHPSGELEWDGSGARVRSEIGGHCEWPELTAGFGIPSLIVVEDGKSFWAVGPTPRESSWRWTGYAHHEWEIWQGSDPLKIYIVQRDDEHIAFEYQAYGCI